MPLKTFFEKHKVKVLNNNQPKNLFNKIIFKKNLLNFGTDKELFLKKVNKNFLFFVVDGLAK
jgi:hypothetical protein